MIKRLYLTIGFTLATIIISPLLILATLLDLITDGDYSKTVRHIWEK